MKKIYFIGYLAFIIFIIISANMGWFGSVFHLIGKVPGGDQTGHFCLMGFFGFMACWFFGGRFIKLWKLKIPWGSLVVILFVTIEEFTQIFIARRSFDLADLAADFGGITLFSLIWYWLVFNRSENKNVLSDQ